MRDLIKELEKYSMHVSMPDGTVWEVPIRPVLESRARHFCKVDGISFEESLDQESEMFFGDRPNCLDAYIITDWAENDMNWEDVCDLPGVKKVEEKSSVVDYQEGWVNGHKEIVKK